jgi:choline dehydrogenase
MATSQCDFVIVGGGSAGSALGNRLSADRSNRVLVLEAGRMDYAWDAFIHMPSALSFPIGNKFYDWKYESEPEPFMNGRRVYHARGKVLGGSSSINGMIFQRGNAMDYQRWGGDPGMEAWDYAHCLPYFKRMETCLAADIDDPYRGHSGPLVLERGPGDEPAVRRVLRGRPAGGLSAHGRRERLPAGGLRGLRPQHPQRPAAVGGARLPAPVMSRPNLEVKTHAYATQILFEGKRAVGVRYVTGRGRSETVRAGEVILCGGAINSPQLLQLSGVGNADELRAAGVDVVHDLPGVGENLQDHLEVYIQYASKQPVSVAPYIKWRNRPRVGLEWALFHSGSRRDEPLRGPAASCAATRRRVAQPDVPLPAHRDPLRRLPAGCRARLPGAHRADDLRRPAAR